MHAAVRGVVEAVSDASEDVAILDTEASPEHLYRGTTRFADAMLVVVEPYYKSLVTGRRTAVLARDLGLEHVALVANKVHDDRELEAVRQFAAANGLELAGSVPYDERLPEAERGRRAPFDYAPDAPAVAAIGALADRLMADGRA